MTATQLDLADLSSPMTSVEVMETLHIAQMPSLSRSPDHTRDTIGWQRQDSERELPNYADVRLAQFACRVSIGSYLPVWCQFQLASLASGL